MLQVPPTPTARALRVLVVDDEPTARRRIVRLLGEMPAITIVGECASGRDAIHAIRAQAPDVVFLDIAMPGIDGIAVARRFAADHGPLVVFVTAYDEHALEAFRLHAADYVLKPIDRERLRNAVEYLRLTVRRTRAERSGQEPFSNDVESPTRSTRLSVRDGYRTHVIPIADVLWVESFGNYVRLYTPVARYTHRATMAEMAEQLAPHGFARIHRTAVVNALRIVQLQPRRNGQYEALLDTGLRLRVSRTYRGVLDAVRAR
jgi:two-component system LytT family response regulator